MDGAKRWTFKYQGSGEERKKLEFDTELDNKIREITAKYGGV